MVLINNNTEVAPVEISKDRTLYTQAGAAMIVINGRLDGVTLCRHSCALCGDCGGILGGQSGQYAAAVFGQYGFQ